MSSKEVGVRFNQSTLSHGDKYTIEGVGVDSLGRDVLDGLTFDGKKAKGKVELKVFTVNTHKDKNYKEVDDE